MQSHFMQTAGSSIAPQILSSVVFITVI